MTFSALIDSRLRRNACDPGAHPASNKLITINRTKFTAIPYLIRCRRYSRSVTREHMPPQKDPPKSEINDTHRNSRRRVPDPGIHEDLPPEIFHSRAAWS